MSYYAELPIESIELDIENPRIKQFLEIYHGELNSAMISLALQNSTGDNTGSYNVLKESIKVQKGLIHPILVNHVGEKYTAIEGNTRLQIYKEFKVVDPEGPWDKIRCIVYDNLTAEEIHAIRLQSHLVGPRDWDPFSKAKYLSQLSNVEHLPMEKIISMCGGNKQEILKLIKAYEDMIQYFAPLYGEGEMDVRDFSKFSELQNKSIKQSLTTNGYSLADYAQWVFNKNIDTAQNVRQLPQIFTSKEATDEFLKNNISSAIKRLAISQSIDKNIHNYTYDALVLELLNRLRTFGYSEIKELRNDHELSPSYQFKRTNIFELQSWLNDLVAEIEVEKE